MRNGTVGALILTLLFAENHSYITKPGNVYNTTNRHGVNRGPTPDYYDWREQGMVSPVKNQQGCNACWAFCVVANIESHLKIYLNVEETLSEQFLIDCDEDNKGCGSASILKTYADVVTRLGGVLRDSDYYPYAGRPLPCRWQYKEIKSEATLVYENKKLKSKATLVDENKKSKSEASLVEENNKTKSEATLVDENKKSKSEGMLVANGALVPVVGFRRVLPNEETMAEFLYQNGPLSAAINSASMAKYEGGIDEPTDADCNPKDLNHSILIVGYNVYVSEKTGEQLPYWIIKNSWGTEWGDDGFYYLVRGRNACGIASDVSFAYVN